jgi:hypothetical protein
MTMRHSILLQQRHEMGSRDDRVFAFYPLRDEGKEILNLRLPEGESLGVSVDAYGGMLLLIRTGGRDFRCSLYKHQPQWRE